MAAPGNGFLGRGLDISLAALQQQDPYICGIVDVASQVALYTFSHTANEWEKTDVEGALFVYARSASPNHGFTIMNRLSMENRTEPITKDLDFQLQDPFLLYRNARFFIYGIWFYDKEECQRIAKLMKSLTQQEQLKAQGAPNGVSPMTLNSGDSKEVDILQMLTKARDEYTKFKPSSEPKLMSSSSAIYSNPNLIKPIAVKPSETTIQPTDPPQGKLIDPEPQRLSLSTLFGKSEKALEGEHGKLHHTVRPTVVRSLSYEEPARANESGEDQLCPAIQKLMVRGAILHPVSEMPEKRSTHGSTIQTGSSILTDLFQPSAPNTSMSIPDHERGKTLLHKLHNAHSSLPKTDLGHPTAHCFTGMISNVSGTDAVPSSLGYYDCCHQTQRTLASVSQIPISSPHPPATGTISPQELLRKLNLVRQEQQLHTNPRPALAAKFPVVSQSCPKPTWGEKITGTSTAKPNPLLQVISPQRIPATVSPEVLMSPMVFTQPSLQTSDTSSVPSPSKEPSNGAYRHMMPLLVQDSSVCSSTQSTVLTKYQLQGTLLYLLQNDESFLTTIYDTYLSVVAKCANPSKKM